jgi:hypothetical protein
MGAHHGRFVDNHHAARTQPQLAGVEELHRLSRRQTAIPAAALVAPTALPVGATTSTCLEPRAAPARRARSEWVLPAPAGAHSGCTKNGEAAMVLTARA